MSNAIFQAHCLTINNPFNPAIGRDIKVLNEPLCIHQITPDTNRPFVVIKNGDYVLRKDWNQPISDGDNLAVVMLPQGGNNGGSDVGRIILTIVVIVAAYYTGGWVAGTEGLGMGAGWGAAASASVSFVGFPSFNIHLEASQ